MRANRRLAQLWLDALSTELGASAGTIDTYTDDLTCYLTWLENQNLALDHVTLEQIRDYIVHLDQRGYAGSTVARSITVIRNLHRFLIAEDLGSSDPTTTMPAMRRPRKLPFVGSVGWPLPPSRLRSTGRFVRDALCLRHADQRGAVSSLRCRSTRNPHAAGLRQG